ARAQPGMRKGTRGARPPASEMPTVVAPWRGAGGIWTRILTGAVISPAYSQRRHQTPPRRAIQPQVGQGTASDIVTTAVPPDAASAAHSRSSATPPPSTPATPAGTRGPTRAGAPGP